MRCRLDWLATEVRNVVDTASLGVPEVFHYSIPILDETGDGRIEPAGEIGSGKLRLTGGEVLISKLNPRLPRVLVAESHKVPTISSTEFIALRPGPSLDTGYLVFLLQSERTRQFLDGATMSVTRSQQRVRPEVLTKSWWDVPEIQTQRAIADYLDTETARIDALIAKKQRMIELLDERLAVAIDGLLGPVVSGIRLKHRVELLPGYAFSSEDFAKDAPGVRLLRGVNVNPDGLNWDDSVQLREAVPVPRRYELRASDVVLGMDRPFVSTGTRATLVDDQSAGALLVQRVCRLRAANPSVAELVVAALKSDRFRRYIEADLSGVSVPHLSDSQIGMYAIPDTVAEGDAAVASRIADVAESHGSTRSRLNRQIELLREHRQALITAAVTGELEVPGVTA